MTKIRWMLLAVFLLALTACSTPVETETPAHTPTSQPVSPTDAPSQGVLLELPTPIPGTVALDFSAKPCSASWSNNGEYLPCPGNLDAISGGYANRFDETIITGGIHIQQPGLLTIPAQPESRFSAIFGKYPPFTVMDGDHFRAVLACQDEYPLCDADLSLEYYNANGQVIQIPEAKWSVNVEGPEYIYADADLSAFSGRTIQFSLTVRDNGSPEDTHIVWIMPHIARMGGAATDAIPPSQLEITNIETVQVSGTVEMQSAPPYLYDDHPPGSPAAVVFFDVESDLWYTTSTAGQVPNFSIALPPGNYYALAFAYGVGDLDYVSATYTGIDPSCGQEMAVLQVYADKPLSGVKINDWNWSCGGSAPRLEKPEEVALP